jgi:hypothetical protein
MVSTFLKVYMDLASYFVSVSTNKRHHHYRRIKETPASVIKRRLGNKHQRPSLKGGLELAVEARAEVTHLAASY